MLICFVAVGCTGPDREKGGESTEQTEAPFLNFTDVTQSSGVDFVHFNDATERRLLPETMGSGVALFDFDSDGDPDLFFVNGTGLSTSERASGALYENLGDWRFSRRTGIGLDEPIYGMGAAVADFDGDGWIDLFVSGLGEDRLYRNLGGERFEDVSARFGLVKGGFSASAAFLDYDRDGWLDLYVARYVAWSREGDVRCAPDGVHPTYCTPEVYEGAPNVLYRNLGGERFEEVTRQAGLWQPEGKSLGVVVLDLEADGWPDLAVANDTSRNTLYRNLGRGAGGGGAAEAVRFEEIGVEAGFAYSESGATRGGMGIDSGDVDGDGRPDLAVGNFAQEMTALYRARDSGNYVDDAAQRGVGLPTLLPLAFGTLLFDRDGDGDLDLALVNGHIEPEIERTRPLHSYAQPPQLFDNDGDGHFTEVEPAPGDAFAAPLVGRGLAAADLDGDGDLDLAVTQNGRPARLYRNEADPASWLRVALRGRGGATPYGAVVRVTAGDRTWVRSLVSGRSYLSAGEPVLTFGLDGAQAIDRVVVRWPDGIEQTVEAPDRNRRLVVERPPDR